MSNIEQVESGVRCPRCASPRVMPLSRDRESQAALTARCLACTAVWAPSPEQLVSLWWSQGYRDRDTDLRQDPALARVLRGWPKIEATGRRVIELMVAELLERRRAMN